jgi:hypothetical protein
VDLGDADVTSARFGYVLTGTDTARIYLGAQWWQAGHLTAHRSITSSADRKTKTQLHPHMPR